MSRAGWVYLMAGAGPGTGPRSVRFHKDCVAATGKKKPRIAYVGAASGDNVGFEKMLGAMIFGLGADVVSVRLTKKATKTSEAKQRLADADIVFVSGGDVDEGMRAIHERDLASFFRALHAEGKIMEGVSAGSIMLGKHWVRFPGEDEEKAEIFDCLGVVPESFDTHGENDGWEELQVLARLLGRQRSGGHVHGIPSGGCAIWDGKALRALGIPLNRYVCADPQRAAQDLAPEGG